LGKRTTFYWSVLSKRVQEIVDSTAPDPVLYDANGKSVRGAISSGFLEWVKANNLSKNDALYEHLGTLPVDLSLVALAGDPRGLPIFRKGLLSPNYAVRAMAARGLAVLRTQLTGPSTSNPGDFNLANSAAGLGWKLRNGALASADINQR
jgi:hypothetical protein